MSQSTIISNPIHHTCVMESPQRPRKPGVWSASCSVNTLRHCEVHSQRWARNSTGIQEPAVQIDSVPRESRSRPAGVQGQDSVQKEMVSKRGSTMIGHRMMCEMIKTKTAKSRNSTYNRRAPNLILQSRIKAELAVKAK